MIDRIGRRLRSVSPRSWRNLMALSAPFLIGLVLLRLLDLDEALTPDRIRAEVLALGAAGLLFYLLAAFVRPLFVVLSGSLFAIAAGMVWGPWVGTALAATGTLLSTLLLVALSRALGRDAVRELAGSRWDRLAASARRRGFAFVFVATLGYVFPTDLVVAVAASTGVRRRSVILASALGSLPGTAAMTFVGSTFSDPASAPWWIGVGVAVLLTAFSLGLARRLFRPPVRRRPRLAAPRIVQSGANA